jgi:glycine dehydrogenase subunit 1
MGGKHLIPNSSRQVTEAMLKALGLSSIDDLFRDVPEEVRFKGELKIPEGLSEVEVERLLEERLSQDSAPPTALCFLGGGVWLHHVPAVVDEVLGKAEFYTAYTPYQPEVSQGMLQALFEYQSLICDLTGMGVANSSLYDWASAVGEAARMAARVTGRRRIVASRAAGGERLAVLKTYCEPAGIEVEVVDFDHETGATDLGRIEAALDGEAAALYIENPNFFGVIEEGVVGLGEAAHRVGALFIVGVDPTTLGLLKPPGEYGADIVVGEGQPLGLPLNYGGPLLGIFAVRDDPRLVRQMPGRLIGATTTLDGSRRGYTMVLQTREQHIRRERATSNICTNEALMALGVAVYLALLGGEGLQELGRTLITSAHYAADLLGGLASVEAPYFKAPFFREFTARVEGLKGEELFRRLAEHRVYGGLPLQRFYPELEEVVLFSITELHSPEDLKRLAAVVEEVAAHV